MLLTKFSIWVPQLSWPPKSKIVSKNHRKYVIRWYNSNKGGFVPKY